MNKSVSVIIPCFNCRDTIEETVFSVLNQGYDPLEIILIDDGSTDGTLSFIKEKFVSHENVKLFSQKNSGVSRARNYGVSVSSGQLITFLDSDDLFLEGKLQHQVEYLVSHGLDVVFSNIIRFEDIADKRLWYITTSPPVVNCNNYLHSVATMDLFSYANFSTGIFKRDVLVRNSWNENLRTGEDWELWARIADGNYQFGNFSATTNCYRKHQNNTTKKYIELMTLSSHISIINMMNIDDDLKKNLAREKITYYSNILKNRDDVTFSQNFTFLFFLVNHLKSISLRALKNVALSVVRLK